jgi:hypothetical protein
LIAAEWNELTAIGMMESSEEPMLQFAVLGRFCQLSCRLASAAAKIQVANQLKGLGTNLLNIEPDQIVIEWMLA